MASTLISALIQKKLQPPEVVDAGSGSPRGGKSRPCVLYPAYSVFDQSNRGCRWWSSIWRFVCPLFCFGLLNLYVIQSGVTAARRFRCQPPPYVNDSQLGDVFAQLTSCQRLLTARDVAKILAISEKTVYSYVSRNMIPYYKIEANVRFRALEVAEWLRHRAGVLKAVTSAPMSARHGRRQNIAHYALSCFWRPYRAATHAGDRRSSWLVREAKIGQPENPRFSHHAIMI